MCGMRIKIINEILISYFGEKDRRISNNML